MMGKKHHFIFIGVVALTGGVFFLTPKFFQDTYKAEVAGSVVEDKVVVEEKEQPLAITHIPTPSAVKTLYMTSWVAGTPSRRDHVLSIADTTEINSILFDIKDDTGKISYPVEDSYLEGIGSSERRIKNLREFTNMLHEKDLYIIGRIAVFQDPYLVSQFPKYAVRRGDDTTQVWKDRKGLTWLDAGEQKVWDYVLAIARDAHAQGVDEINFDYIRFPSDGDMKNIYFPKSEGKVKADVIKSFWQYVYENLKDSSMTTSADLFGMTTSARNDLNIGQILENALPYFDYVAPMVYPSHYPKTWNGLSDPELYPYETIKLSMQDAVDRAVAMGEDPLKLRPWLQDFGLRTTYGAKEVREQIQATYDVGLTSWMIWDPSNRFTKGAFLTE